MNYSELISGFFMIFYALGIIETVLYHAACTIHKVSAPNG